MIRSELHPVSAAFDPYHKWLGISPYEQPADYYRLLGLARFESDPDVIESAADQRLAHLKTFQNGPRAAHSQRLMTEVAAARVCLLDPSARLAYDQQFYDRQPPPLPKLDTAAPLRAPNPARPRTKHRRRSPSAVVVVFQVVAGGVVGLGLSYLLLAFLLPTWDRFGWFHGKVQESMGAREPLGSRPDPPRVDGPLRTGSLVTGNAPKVPASFDPASESTLPAVERQEQPRVQMTPWVSSSRVTMRSNLESFGVLTGVSGHFLGAGEWFRMHLDAEQNWYVQASGVQPVSVRAASVVWPTRNWFVEEVVEHHWGPGSQSVPLISAEDGFAVLSGANGCFLDAHHFVRVQLADGQWQLSGNTNFGTQGFATVYRYRHPGRFRSEVREHTWKTTMPPLELLRVGDGLCFLSGISGGFHGGGERVSLDVGEDGKWYLSGQSQQPTTAGQAMSIRFLFEPPPP